MSFFAFCFLLPVACFKCEVDLLIGVLLRSFISSSLVEDSADSTNIVESSTDGLGLVSHRREKVGIARRRFADYRSEFNRSMKTR